MTARTLTPPIGCYWQRYSGDTSGLGRRFRYVVDVDGEHFAFTERRASRRFYRIAEEACAEGAGWHDRFSSLGRRRSVEIARFHGTVTR